MMNIIDDFKQASAKIIDCYETLVAENRSLRVQLTQTKDELMNAKIEELEHKYDTLNKSAIAIFPLVEMNKWRAFKIKHQKDCRCSYFMHESGSTAIMDYFSIKCPQCDEELTIYN